MEYLKKLFISDNKTKNNEERLKKLKELQNEEQRLKNEIEKKIREEKIKENNKIREEESELRLKSYCNSRLTLKNNNGNPIIPKDCCKYHINNNPYPKTCSNQRIKNLENRRREQMKEEEEIKKIQDRRINENIKYGQNRNKKYENNKIKEEENKKKKEENKKNALNIAARKFSF